MRFWGLLGPSTANFCCRSFSRVPSSAFAVGTGCGTTDTTPSLDFLGLPMRFWGILGPTTGNFSWRSFVGVASSAFTGGTGFATSDTMPSLHYSGSDTTFSGLLGASTVKLSRFSAASGRTSGASGALHSVLTSRRGEIISTFGDSSVTSKVEGPNDSKSYTE